MTTRRRGRIALLVAAAALGACSRSAATSADAGGEASLAPLADASAPDAPEEHAEAAPPAPSSDQPLPPVEARRERITRGAHPLALRHAATLTKHFGGAMPAVLDVQIAELSVPGRSALLFAEANKPHGEARPTVLVEDGDRAIVWSKERPTAGIMPPAGEMALAPGPRGRVAIAVCDPPTSTVALRLWDDDGSPFADFQALSVEACDEVSLFFWPRHGWVIVVARSGATVAQLVSERGTLEWSRGVDVAARPRVAAPVSVAADTEQSIVMIQNAGPSTLAFRYDARGAPLWPAAVEVARPGKPPSAGARVELQRVGPGLLRARLPAAFDVDVGSSGAVAPHR